MLDIKKFQAIPMKYLNKLAESHFVIFFITWVITLLTIQNVNKVPVSVKKVLNHPISHMVAIFLSIFVNTKNLYVSFATTVAIMFVFHVMSMYSENFDPLVSDTDVFPGCLNVTIEDLAKMFKSPEEFKNVMHDCKVPSNVELTDENAPLIATYLINSGLLVSGECRAPH